MSKTSGHHIFDNSECLSLDLMKRYLDDNVSAEERQYVERHLVDCPLCSEAMEGMAEHKLPKAFGKQISSVNQRIGEESGMGKERSLPFDLRQIAAVLALVALVGGGIYLGIKYIPSTGQVAQKTDKKTTKTKRKTEKTPPPEKVELADKNYDFDSRMSLMKFITGDSLSDTFISATPSKDVLADQRTPGFQERDRSDSVGGFIAQASEAERDTTSQSMVFGGSTGATQPAEDTNNQQIALLEESEQEDREEKSKRAEDEEINTRRDKTNQGVAANRKAKKESNAAIPSAPSTATETTAEEQAQGGLTSPHYPGGAPAMQKFIEKHLQYPEKAKEQGIEGTVYVRCKVKKNGRLTNIKVIKGVEESLNKEAIRIVKKMPHWVPATRNKQPVKDTLTIPIKFKR